MRKLIVVLFFAFAGYLGAQAQNTNFPVSKYRSADNPLYWKNRPPFPGYWQQDIYVNLEASLDDSLNTIDGKENLVYYNNSPDTLHELYFHLYQNAFQPGSYLDDQYKDNKVITNFGHYEKQGLGTTVSSCIEDGNAVAPEIDNTMMRIKLKKPLVPNASVNVQLVFRTYFDNGSMRRRMKMFKHDGVTQYDGVHWYPRVSVYDRKFGWTTDQHLNREFYGDFGTFDVSLSLPSQYILEATGTLLNENEVMPKDLREKLDIKNFAKQKNGITEIIKKDGSRKTWKYHAEDVHDFAWTCDPSYRIGEVDWNGVRCIALAQESAAWGWQHTAAHVAKVIETYSKDFGMYAWPKIVVADARDGMEYPMLTLCGGTEPGSKNVINHEVGHEWFFGMLGNNETYRAMLDEGFTQFLTVWSFDRMDNGYPPHSPKADPFNLKPAREGASYYGYLRSAIQGDNTTLNTHSDQFNGAIGQGGGYGLVYHKTSTMLFNLQYVLGDSLFLRAMSHYFNQWKICHPYVEDFRNSIISYTHVDLNWFFDQWIETSKVIDYEVKKVKRGDAPGEYNVTFKRKGRMQMPIDFTVYNKEGQKFSYYIPNTDFQKHTSATTLPKWQGWDNIREEYTATVKINGKLKNVVIDTSYRLADINLLNNSLKCPEKWHFANQQVIIPDRRYYLINWRPDAWFNSVDGVKIGLHLDGNYFALKDQFDMTMWYNTSLGKDTRFDNKNGFEKYFNFNLNYKNSLTSIDKDMSWNFNGRVLDGLYLGKIGIDKNFPGNVTMSVYAKSMYRPDANDLNYLLYPDQWNAGKWNNTLNFSIVKRYNNYHSTGSYGMSVKSSTLFSNYDYSTFNAQWLHNLNLGKLQMHGRWVANYSTGISIAPESQLMLAGANEEELMENKFLRSKGFVDEAWLGYGNTINHLQEGGGLNLRGYAGYLAPLNKDNNQLYTYMGTAGTAVNLELDFDKLVHFKPPVLRNYFSLSTYLFMDAGSINYNGLNAGLKLDDIRMDAGIGTALTIKSWGKYTEIRPLTLRFDMPFFVNAVPFDESNNFKFRWVVGIGRAF